MNKENTGIVKYQLEKAIEFIKELPAEQGDLIFDYVDCALKLVDKDLVKIQLLEDIEQLNNVNNKGSMITEIIEILQKKYPEYCMQHIDTAYEILDLFNVSKVKQSETAVCPTCGKSFIRNSK